MAKPKKYLLISPDNKHFVVSGGKGEFSTHLGTIDLKKIKVGKVKSNLGYDFYVTEPTFLDMLLHSKRGPAVVLPKDAAAILMYSGISPGAKVVDIGTGSGWLAAMLANAVGREGSVTTYEIREQFASLAKRNFQFLGLKNVRLKMKDGTKKIDERSVDLVVVDLPEPWLALKEARKALKPGRFFVAAVPQITQVLELTKALSDFNFKLERVLEVQERRWVIKQKTARPEHLMLGHTTFLAFARRI